MNYAFTAITDADGYSIGRADVGISGYSPIPSEGQFDTYDAATDRANVMNAELGIEPKEAIKIVLGTMGPLLMARTIFEEHHADRLGEIGAGGDCTCSRTDQDCLLADAEVWAFAEDHQDYLEWRSIIDSARRIVARLKVTS